MRYHLRERLMVYIDECSAKPYYLGAYTVYFVLTYYTRNGSILHVKSYYTHHERRVLFNLHCECQWTVS